MSSGDGGKVMLSLSKANFKIKIIFLLDNYKISPKIFDFM